LLRRAAPPIDRHDRDAACVRSIGVDEMYEAARPYL
jgi:hypothetical protein